MIRVLGDRVLVLLPPQEAETVTAGGIILTRDPDFRKIPTRGIVAQLGERANTCDLNHVRSDVHTWFVEQGDEVSAFTWVGQTPLEAVRDAVDRVLMGQRPASFDVAVGDCVIFAPGDGEEVALDGHTYVILAENQILGIVEPQQNVA